MTTDHHPPHAPPVGVVEDSLMERWIREGVDLLVPASMAKGSTSLLSLPSSSSSSKTSPPSSPASAAAKRTSCGPAVPYVEDDLRLKWLVVIFTTGLFLLFQLLCLLSFFSLSSSSSFLHYFASTSYSSYSSSSLWAGAACVVSMAIELGLVWTLYLTRDLPLVAASLAGATNAFVFVLTLLSSGFSHSDLFVWLVYGSLLIFFVFGGRFGLYATAAVALQSTALSFLLPAASSVHSSSIGPFVRAVGNVTALVCIGALAYAGERSRFRAQQGLRTALARCEESHDKLRQASETKQKFLANMSHELRTPLHGITSTALELLETLSPVDKAARECCHLIAECGRLMRSLIEDILDFEQIESNRLMLDKLPFDIVQEVERAVRVLAGAAAKKRIDIDTSTASVAHPLHVGDPLRFRQIVFNLLSNAIKFTPDGGRIRVSITNSDAAPEQVNVEVADNGIGIGPDHLPHLFLGFSQEDNSARRRHGGTGLGLAISKSLCEAMGGSIGCRSEPGHGSTFHFTVVLPVAPASTAAADASTSSSPAVVTGPSSAESLPSAAEAGAQASETHESSSSSSNSSPASPPASPTPGGSAGLPSRPQTAGSLRPLTCSSTTFIPSPLTVPPVKSPVMESSLDGVRVLLVEDNMVNQKVGMRMLASLGCVVTVAVNGEECLRILEAAEAEPKDKDTDVDDCSAEEDDGERDRGFDAVLMDCQMPVMDGFQATALIRERERKRDPTGRPLPVIALTASATKEYREQCFLSGMNDWLAKPFTKANLAHMLRKWARPSAADQDHDHDDSSSSSSNDINSIISNTPTHLCT